jgi:integrase
MGGLTEKGVRAARAKDKEVFLWDGALPGFGCRIKPPSAKNPDGVKTFLVQYRKGAKTHRAKIGRYPIFNVVRARKQAIKMLAAIGEGGNPAIEKKQERQAKRETVRAVADDFIRRYAKAKGRRSWPQTKRIFDIYVCPRLGNRALIEIGRRDVIELLDHVAEHNGPIMANRVLSALRRMCGWAAGKDIIPTSPVVNIEKPGQENRRQRALDDLEIRDVWAAADAIGYPYGPLVKMLLLTGQRKGEVAGMRRAELAMTERLWVVPAERMKGKAAHAVPLTEPTAEIVAVALERIPAGAACVFQTERGGDKPANGLGNAKKRLDTEIHKARTAAGLADPPHWTLHDLRRTMRTRLSKLGIDPEIAERVIAHVPGGVRATYDVYQFLNEKAAALALWARALDNILAPSGKVVMLPMSQRA